MMNSLQTLPRWMTFMETPSSIWLGFINVVYWIAFAIGCPVAAWASTAYGRKRALYFSYIPLILGMVMETAAPNSTVFIIGRAFLGFPSGVWANIGPLLITECAHPAHRGRLTALFFCGFYVGAIIAAWCAYGTRNYTNSWTWRTVCILQLVCPVVALPGLALCPESPRWLFFNNRKEEARQILIRTHAGGDDSCPSVQLEINEIELALLHEETIAKKNGYLEMLSTPGNRRRVLITISLGFFSQWAGNGVVSYYLTLVLDTIGITSVTDQTLISGCLQLWNLILAVLGASLVDRCGRRPLFLTSFAMMLVSYIIITACSGVFAESGTKGAGIAVIPFLFIFFAGYDIAL
jgi:MFS family permease